MLQLTYIQQLYLPAIRWLLDDSFAGCRAAGRSTLMAMIFVEQAIKDRGKWIHIWDHHPHIRNKKYILRVMRDLVERNYPELSDKIEIRYSDYSFRIANAN